MEFTTEQIQETIRNQERVKELRDATIKDAKRKAQIKKFAKYGLLGLAAGGALYFISTKLN